jgi:lysyl-tRNA synthetase class 1
METMSSSAFVDLANHAKAWPFAEAKLLIERLEKMGGKTDQNPEVIFETGYGPSGLPHIGTFGEVVRTSMVRHAYQILTGKPTRLICFSDDMDGLRKVPDNVPNRDLLALMPVLGRITMPVSAPF